MQSNEMRTQGGRTTPSAGRARVAAVALAAALALAAPGCDEPAGSTLALDSSLSFWLNTQERNCGTWGWQEYLAAWPPALADDDDDDAERRLQLRERLRGELGERYGAPLPEATEDELRTGAGIWEALCAGCHGMTARGTATLSLLLPVPPGDLADPRRAAFFSERAKLRIVADGSPGTPMVGWKGVLTEADRRAVIAHLRTLASGDPEQP